MEDVRGADGHVDLVELQRLGFDARWRPALRRRNPELGMAGLAAEASSKPFGDASDVRGDAVGDHDKLNEEQDAEHEDEVVGGLEPVAEHLGNDADGRGGAGDGTAANEADSADYGERHERDRGEHVELPEVDVGVPEGEETAGESRQA